VAVASLALALMGTGRAATAGTSDPPCGVTDQFTVEPGPTNFVTQGSTRFTASQADPGSFGGGKLTWNVQGTITGQNTNPTNGNMGGFLDIVIDWNQNRPNTEFHSSCVGNVGTSVGHIGASYLGGISNYPANVNAQGLDESAFAHIEFDRTGSPEIADLHIFMDFGDLCTAQNPHLEVNRPSAHAPGHKTGNGARAMTGCD